MQTFNTPSGADIIVRHITIVGPAAKSGRLTKKHNFRVQLIGGLIYQVNCATKAIAEEKRQKLLDKIKNVH